MLLKYERLFNFNQHYTEIGSPVLSPSQQSLPVYVYTLTLLIYFIFNQ